MSINYLMTLKPLQPFFFGGEHTFGADEIRKESSRYRAISTKFPQQSAVIGMLRKTLLIEEEHMTMHKNGEWVDSKEREEAKQLCGSEPFRYNAPTDLGIIESISPLFIKKDSLKLTPDAFDADFTPHLDENIMVIRPKTQNKAIRFENFNAKDGKIERLIDQEGDTHAYEEFFETVESVGITKARDGKTKEKAFFMKQSFMLKNSATFAFIATFAKPLKFKKSYVALGADNSPFMLEAEEFKGNFNEIFANVFKPKSISRVIALSEIYLSQKAYEETIFILGSRTKHKQIIDSKKFKKSEIFYLFNRGSVFYTETPDKLTKELSIDYLQKGGINHFVLKKIDHKGEK